MSKINVLTPDIYNKISAGEVVESPVGAVKELVENSIDAGANRIVIEVEEGGFALISVSDNGCGIEEDDIEHAFLKHATSKISKIDDLYDVETLGFRGEALSSISAVSHVSLTTKTAEATCAVHVDIDNGKVSGKDYVAAATGTKIEVRDLFYNTPARKKFFKTPQKEGLEITKFVAKFILTNPDVEIKYLLDGEVVYEAGGRGPGSALFAVYGADCASRVMRIDYESGDMGLHGFIGHPDFSKPNRTYQVFSVNGRCVTDSKISNCIGQAYKAYLMTRQYPFYVLNVTLPADRVDVNVHPKKSEVRFADGDRVGGMIYRVVQNNLQAYVREQTSLLIHGIDDTTVGTDVASTDTTSVSDGNNNAVSTYGKNIGLTATTVPTDTENGQSTHDNVTDNPTFGSQTYARTSYASQSAQQQSFLNADYLNRDEKSDIEEIERATEEVDRAQAFERFAEEMGSKISVAQARREMGLDDTKDANGTLSVSAPDLATETNPPMPTVHCVYEDPDDKSKALFDRARILGVAFKTYLIIELDEKIIFVDQHAAHERILFEKFKEGRFNEVSQPLLFPYVFKVKSDEAQFISDNLDDIKTAGVEIEPFGSNTFRIVAVSALLANTEMNKFVDFVLSQMEEFKVDDRQLRVERLAQMACKAAVKAGQTLNEYEIKYILKTIVEGNLMQCPHGRPVTVVYTKTQMDKWFKRIVS